MARDARSNVAEDSGLEVLLVQHGFRRLEMTDRPSELGDPFDPGNP